MGQCKPDSEYNWSPIDWAKCGTEANYIAHRRLGETPCDACRKAATAAKLARRNRYRTAQAAIVTRRTEVNARRVATRTGVTIREVDA